MLLDKTKVLRFAINDDNDNINVTVNENDALNLTCEIEGLPLPTGQLLLQSFLNKETKKLPNYLDLQNSANRILTSSFPAQCTDTGVHTCSGSNKLYNGSESVSSRSVSLFVLCKYYLDI